MDQYIKRKQKKLQTKDKQSVKVQSHGQIISRQTRQQLKELIIKIEYVEDRCNKIRQRLKDAELSERILHERNSQLLGGSSMQKPLVTPEIFDRNTSQTNPEFSKISQLERTERMAEKVSSDTTDGREIETPNDKLQQSSKVNGKPRKIRKRF